MTCAVVVAGVRQALALGRQPGTLGDRTLLPATMTEALPQDVEAAFGNDFARQLAAIDGEWLAGSVDDELRAPSRTHHPSRRIDPSYSGGCARRGRT